MQAGQTVYVIHRTQNVISGVLGDETTAQGFYTRWGSGHKVYLRTAGIQAKEVPYNDEDIFCTKEEATKEIFKRRLRYAGYRKSAA